MFIFNAQTVDPYLLFVIGISCAVSFIRGLIREILSLLFWIAAFWVGFNYASEFTFLFKNFSKSNSIQFGLAFLSLFLATLFLGMILNYLLWILIKKTGLSGTDRLLGLIFGMVRGLLIATILLVLARVTPLGHEVFFADSMMAVHLKPLSDPMQTFIQKQLMSFLPEIKKGSETAVPVIEIPKKSNLQNANDLKTHGSEKLLPRTD